MGAVFPMARPLTFSWSSLLSLIHKGKIMLRALVDNQTGAVRGFGRTDEAALDDAIDGAGRDVFSDRIASAKSAEFRRSGCCETAYAFVDLSEEAAEINYGFTGRLAEDWWIWHDATGDRMAADLDEAEARCRAWVEGNSDDGPSIVPCSDCGGPSGIEAGGAVAAWYLCPECLAARVEAVDAHEADAGEGADWVAHEPVSAGVRAELERRGIKIVTE